MLVKRTRGNQVSIPKRVLEAARVPAEHRYFDVTCRGGVIVLKPVRVEDDIPDRAYEELLRWAKRPHPGDKVFHSGREAVEHLRKLTKPSR